MKKFIIIIICVILLNSCKTIDSWIPPEKQCMLVKRGSSTAIMMGLSKVKSVEIDKIKKHAKEITNIIQKQILPILKKKRNVGILKNEWDKILTQLDLKLSKEEKLIIQQAMLVLLQFAPIPKEGSKSFGSRFVYLAKCMFEGIVDGLSGFFKKDITLKKEFKKMCKECIKPK